MIIPKFGCSWNEASRILSSIKSLGEKNLLLTFRELLVILHSNKLES